MATMIKFVVFRFACDPKFVMDQSTITEWSKLEFKVSTVFLVSVTDHYKGHMQK